MTVSRRLAHSRRGFALILAIMIAMVMSTLSIALFMTSQAELNGSRAMLAKTESRSLTTSALDDFYARIRNIPGFLDAVLGSDQAAAMSAYPAYTPAELRDTPGMRWAYLDGVTAVDCNGTDQYDRDCFSVSAINETTGGGTTSGDGAILLDVTARVRCGGVASRCVYLHTQQRLRQIQFFDYLFFEQFTALDPVLYPSSMVDWAKENCANRYALRTNNGLGARSSSCMDVAYVGEDTSIRATPRVDVIAGPLYTADDRIVVCGNPEFQGAIAVSGAGVSGRPYATVGDARSETCPPTSLSLPSGSRVNAPLLELPSAATSTAQAAEVADPSYVFDGNIDVTLSTSGDVTTINVTGAGAPVSLPIPSAPTPAVLVSRGNVNIRGELAGKLSVFAGGDIVIDDNLTYHNGGSTSNTSDILGLTAAGSIRVTQASTPTPRTIHAVMLSLGSAIFTEDWDEDKRTPIVASPSPTPTDTATPTASPTPSGSASPSPSATASFTSYDAPKLTFFGAMASKYQGVFSGFLPSSGEIVSGYEKDFAYDTRLKNHLIDPPYLVAPVASAWERLPAVEAAVDVAAPTPSTDGTVNQQPGTNATPSPSYTQPGTTVSQQPGTTASKSPTPTQSPVDPVGTTTQQSTSTNQQSTTAGVTGQTSPSPSPTFSTATR